MKKAYVTPEVCQLTVAQEDILTLSVGNGNNIYSVTWDEIDYIS